VRHDRSRPLTSAQQFINLRSDPICAGTGLLRASRPVWRYSASPMPLSRAYQLRIEYRQDGVPQVFVYDPDLRRLAEGRRLPHVYQQRPTRLCLYLPRAREWSGWMRIDQTIVPWAALLRSMARLGCMERGRRASPLQAAARTLCLRRRPLGGN
jgi:hypothetical protein